MDKLFSIMDSKWFWRLFFVVGVPVAFIISMFVADLIYGDWRCAIAECRIVK